MKKILILYASPGSGHKIAAYSLFDLIKENFENEVFLEDPLSKSLFPYSKSKEIYDFISNYPRIWKFFYYLSHGKSYEKFLKIQNFFLKDSVYDVIRKHNPDIIFCTHPFYPPVIKEIYNHRSFKVISVITDFGEIHRAWVIEGFDYLWIPSEFSYKEIEKNFGIKENYEILGYPVRKGFWNIKEKKENYVLVMGGGRGAGPIKKIFEILSEIEINQVYICGTNEKLKKELEEIKKEKNLKHIEIIGYTKDIHEFMAESICVISKPGGSTVAECNFLLKPVVAINPLPGQEEGNAKFIIDTDCGVVLNDLKDLKNIIKKIIDKKIEFKFKEKLESYLKKQINFLQDIIRL